MPDSRGEVLAELLEQAGLPEPADVEALMGRGFTGEVSSVRLVGGGRVVLRRWPEPRALEFPRARFLADHDVPAPQLLAADTRGSLVEFVDGRLLGDLIGDSQDGPSAWRATGAAYRRVHSIAFPSRLAGRLDPAGLVLRPTDPVADVHELLEGATAGLQRRCPEAVEHLAALHDMVDRCAIPLRAAATALLHGDVNMWNVLIGPQHAVLIDWDLPEVGDPAMEVALLDKHAYLFNGRGLPAAFFEGYGPSAEPNTTLHRIVQTVQWAASADWDEFATDPDLPTELQTRAAGWLEALQQYLSRLPEHLNRLSGLVEGGLSRR